MDAGIPGWHCCPVCTGEVVRGVYFPNREAYRFHLRTHIDSHFRGAFGLPKLAYRIMSRSTLRGLFG